MFGENQEGSTNSSTEKKKVKVEKKKDKRKKALKLMVQTLTSKSQKWPIRYGYWQRQKKFKE